MKQTDSRPLPQTRILALDLSLSGTGYATPMGATGRISPPKGMDGPERLDWILGWILQGVTTHSPELVVIEGYALGSHTSHTRAIAELGGLVRWALWKRRIRFEEVPPTSLKVFATGSGKAKKPQMLSEAIHRLAFTGHDDNEVDALWLREYALHALGDPAATPLPQSHTRALDKCGWARR